MISLFGDGAAGTLSAAKAGTAAGATRRKTMRRTIALVAVATVQIVMTCALAQPLTTAFTFQGQLHSGTNAASGTYDLRFALFDSASGGAQVGPLLCSDNLAVVNGLVMVQLDFGSQFAGSKRYVEVRVRQDTGLGCADGTGFVTLLPRQELTAAPNSVFAMNADAATSAASATTATNATQLNSQPASFYQNAANLSAGTIPDARLSSSVELLGLSQIVTGGKTFSAAPSFTAAGAPFSVSSAGLVTNLNADMLDGLHSSAFLQSVPNPLVLSGANPGLSTISGTNTAISGDGLYGAATALTGSPFGVHGYCASPHGAGVFGYCDADNGDNYGVWGGSNSPDGAGVFAQNYAYGNAVLGLANGVAIYAHSSEGAGVHGTTSGPSAYGVWGEANGNADGVGVYGISGSTIGYGVLGVDNAGSGTNYGVYGTSYSPDGFGVLAYNGATAGAAVGLQGQSDSTSGIGVYGLASASSGTNYGVYGATNSSAGYGGYFLGNGYFSGNLNIAGSATANTLYVQRGVQRGGSPVPTNDMGLYSEVSGDWLRIVAAGAPIQFFCDGGAGTTPIMTISNTGGVGVNNQSPAAGLDSVATYNAVRGTSTYGTGIYGTTTQTDGNFAGVYGYNTSSGYGVIGRVAGSTGFGVYGFGDTSTGSAVGVAGATNSGSGWGVYSYGRFGVSGTKSFRIDHPSDPENKYLLHYCAEGPEPENVYNGKVVLNEQGEATVDLPAYFAAINKDPRYTLTAIGAAMPLLHVAEEVSEDVLAQGARVGPGEAIPAVWFRIAGGSPNGKVSWEVKAVRNDRWVQSNGAPVETEKVEREKGTYQHPELYGQPPEKGVTYPGRGGQGIAGPSSPARAAGPNPE
jgi:hypothetical protein